MGQEDGEQESFVLNEQAWLILDIVNDIVQDITIDIITVSGINRRHQGRIIAAGSSNRHMAMILATTMADMDVMIIVRQGSKGEHRGAGEFGVDIHPLILDIDLDIELDIANDIVNDIAIDIDSGISLDIVADIRVWSDLVLGQLTCRLKQQEDQAYSCVDCIGIIQCLMLVDDSYR